MVGDSRMLLMGLRLCLCLSDLKGAGIIQDNEEISGILEYITAMDMRERIVLGLGLSS